MSRVGKMPLPVPKGVDVALNDDTISVKGSMGTLVRPLNALVTVKSDNGRLLFAPAWRWSASAFALLRRAAS